MIPPVRRQRRQGGKLWAGLVGAGAALAGAGLIIWRVPPDQWWVEAAVLMLVWGGVFVAGAWIHGRKKWSWIVSIWVVGILLMRRWGILDWPLFGLWVLVLGVVSLVN